MFTLPASASFREGYGGEFSLLEPRGGTKRDLVLGRQGRVSLQPRGAPHQRENPPGQGRRSHLPHGYSDLTVPESEKTDQRSEPPSHLEHYRAAATVVFTENYSPPCNTLGGGGVQV